MTKKKTPKNKFKLDRILDITQSINENDSIDDLLEKYRNILLEDLFIGKVIVYKFTTHWEPLLASGIESEKIKRIKVEKHLTAYNEITRITRESPKVLWPYDFIIPVFHKESVLAYILIGDIDQEMDGISPAIKHLRFIQTISNIIIVAMENKRMYKELLKQEAFKKEMEVASRIQSQLIPNQNSLPQNKYVSTRAFYQPHREIGGDYYDFINFNNQELGFCIADVSGKGIPAALIMSNFQATLRALFTPLVSLTDLIHQLNQKVCASANNEKFLTIFIGKFNFTTRKLKYINSSHYPPMLYDYETNKTQFLKDGCIGLGMLNEIPTVKEGEVTICDHSKLLCYTDGLVELESGEKMELGLQRLTQLFANSKDIQDTFLDLIQDIEIKQKNHSVIDDISLFGIEFHTDYN
ncbi:MAG: PP2C family protein-serine/threonine phosphatase [Marinifilaceae bacterium]